jgi:hypothetical protein
MFPRGKWQRARARHPAGEPILVRIGSRYPGPHILAKECLVGAGSELFAFSYSPNSGGDMFFGGNNLFLQFWVSALTVFKSFKPFGNFFT